MNVNLKLFFISTICVFVTACATKNPLNRDLIYKEKIETIHLNRLNENISIERSRVNGVIESDLISRVIDTSALSEKQDIISDIPDNVFSKIKENLNDFDVNKVLKNALEHNILDKNVFNENVIVSQNFDKSIKNSYLIPVLTARIVMSADYSEVTISLRSSTTQQADNNDPKQNNAKSTYSSVQRTTLSGRLSSDEQANKQYLLDNPVVLKEKIVDGLYDVTKQFVDDFNAPISNK